MTHQITQREGESRAIKVVGLGAPISVLIRFEACEAAVVVDELENQIAACDSALEDFATAVAAARSDDIQGWQDSRGEYVRMLDEILVDAAPPQQPVAVLCPSALAVRLLRGALGEAVERLHEAAKENTPLRDVRELRDALAVIGVCLDTCADFAAVDGGGLQDVWL